MFAKVFSQIFDSSIADDYETRHLFMDMLLLADWKTGIVDMTHEAIARKTNVPIEIVRSSIASLEGVDKRSRNPKAEGRRIIRLDDHRDWGWKITNYGAYRDIRDEEARKAYFRERKRIQRARQRGDPNVLDSQGLSNDVQLGPPKSPTKTKMEDEEDLLSTAKSSSENKHIKTTSFLTPAAKKKKRILSSKPESKEECVEHCVRNLGLTENDGKALWEHWCGNGFRNNGQPITSWRHTASNWRRRNLFFPSLQSRKL